jgi:hypothetical protein
VLGWTRALSGVFAAGLVVLAISLLAVWGVASAAGVPGPGLTMLVGHAVAAVVALVLHRLARRRTGRVGYLAALGPPAILFLLGVLFWWS